MPFLEEMMRLVGHRPSLLRPHGLDMDTAVRRAQAQLSPVVFGKQGMNSSLNHERLDCPCHQFEFPLPVENTFDVALGHP